MSMSFPTERKSKEKESCFMSETLMDVLNLRCGRVLSLFDTRFAMPSIEIQLIFG
jgi:hypothetical protein